MVRKKATGLVTAAGTWTGPGCRKKARRSRPTAKKAGTNRGPPQTELWGGQPELVRWETAADTSPVHIVADRFIAMSRTIEFFTLWATW